MFCRDLVWQFTSICVANHIHLTDFSSYDPCNARKMICSFWLSVGKSRCKKLRIELWKFPPQCGRAHSTRSRPQSAAGKLWVTLPQWSSNCRRSEPRPEYPRVRKVQGMGGCTQGAPGPCLLYPLPVLRAQTSLWGSPCPVMGDPSSAGARAAAVTRDTRATSPE